MRADRNSTVMMSVALESGQSLNPYITQLVESLRNHVDVVEFSWRDLFNPRLDVFHVHWPEQLLRGNTSARLVKACLLSSFLLLSRARHIRVIRTLHNATPHESGRPLERAVIRLLDWVTDERICLNASDERSVPNAWLVPHGHYRAIYDPHRSMASPERGRILFFGLLRKYKGIEQLIKIFDSSARDTEIAEDSLHICGQGLDDGYTAELRRMCAGLANVHLRAEFIPEDQLVAEIERAEVVVLPYARMANSGALLAALSVDRPVIAPAFPVVAEVQAEVGAEWLATYEGVLDESKLVRALTMLRGADRAVRPNLRLRDWEDACGRHLEAYGLAEGPDAAAGATR